MAGVRMRWSTTKWGNLSGYKAFIYTGKPGCCCGFPAFPPSSPAFPKHLSGGGVLALVDGEVHSDGWWHLERQRCWRVGSEIMHACV